MAFINRLFTTSSVDVIYFKLSSDHQITNVKKNNNNTLVFFRHYLSVTPAYHDLTVTKYIKIFKFNMVKLSKKPHKAMLYSRSLQPFSAQGPPWTRDQQNLEPHI